MENPEPSAGERKKQRGFLNQITVDAIGIASSLVTGAATAWFYIERSAYKNMSSLGTFDDVKPERKQRREAIERGVEEGRITPKESYRLLDSLIEVNEVEAANRMKKLGIANLWDRWGLLRKHQKVETVIFAAAAGGVALGSVLPLARGIFNDGQQETLDQDKQSAGR